MRAAEILFESRAAVLKAEAEAKLLDKQIELERLRLDASAIRAAALEEAADICDRVNNYDNPMTAGDCADAIRALKTKEKT